MNFAINKYNQLLFLALIIIIILFISKNKPFQSQTVIKIETTNESNDDDDLEVKDFKHYKCKHRKRIGGPEQYVLKAPHPLWRIDGAWFVCFDEQLAPISNKCNILSFGINRDESFDYEMNKIYGCSVYSFDPFIESERFATIRKSNSALIDSKLISVNNKWNFYRTGIIGSKGSIKNPSQIGGFDTLENIIKMTDLKNKIIDVFKMDIERGEIEVLKHLDIDYACKYFKQFMLETHPNSTNDQYVYKLLRKLDKCFLLFHRDTRFFKGDIFGTPTGHISEYQISTGWSLNIKDYKNEVNLATFLLSFGELYFVNKNFLELKSLNKD